MYLFKIMIFSLISISSSYGQFSIEHFVNNSYENDILIIKEAIKDKKIEEKENKGMKSITYYDWFNPISIKVVDLFDNEGKQIGRMLLNKVNLKKHLKYLRKS